MPLDKGKGRVTETTRLLSSSTSMRSHSSDESSISLSISSHSDDSGDEFITATPGVYGLDNKHHHHSRHHHHRHEGDVEAGPIYMNEQQEGEGSDNKERGNGTNVSIVKIIVSLLAGVFTANADASLVLATHPIIASEFHDLAHSSWLFISFMLAGAATQSLYGKLSDIYGRKSILLICYGLFAIGCALIGAGQSMAQVIVGRLIAGSAGSGLTLLFAVIIADLAPLREVATWQSYLNIVATTGRSIGGPLGGMLADTIGWRWSFIGQAPIFLFALLYGWFSLPPMAQPSSSSPPTTQSSSAPNDDDDDADADGADETPSTNTTTTTTTTLSKLSRIDFLGAFLLGLGILSILLPLEITGGQSGSEGGSGAGIPWSHPAVGILFAAGVILLGLFVLVEGKFAREPVLPLRLLAERDVVLTYMILACQAAAQLDMMFTVPLYFQVTERSSNTVAGAHLFPAVVGNAVGSVMAGLFIRRYGRYKILLALSAGFSFVSYGLMALRWDGGGNGHHQPMSWWESLYILPGGFGTGISIAVAFVSMSAAIDPADKASAASGFYLSISVGGVVGMAASSAVLTGTMRGSLLPRLLTKGVSLEESAEIIKQAISRVEYLDEAPEYISRIIVRSYVDGLKYSYFVSMALAIVTFLCSMVIRERKLTR